MSGYTGQDNYWSGPGQGQYNFDPAGFGQSNQQFDFQSYPNDQNTEYSPAYSPKPYLDPTQSNFGGNMVYGSDDFDKGT